MEELQEALDLTKKSLKKDDESVLKRDKKEISDAILEVVEESQKNFDIELQVERELQMYAALEREKKGLDYSSLDYGNIAQPLAIEWNYESYRQDDKGFTSNETISMKEVEEIIEEKAFGDISNKANTFLRAQTDERFQYWKLFNAALNIMKYEWAFT
jgi:hypothetical protein